MRKPKVRHLASFTTRQGFFSLCGKHIRGDHYTKTRFSSRYMKRRVCRKCENACELFLQAAISRAYKIFPQKGTA